MKILRTLWFYVLYVALGFAASLYALASTGDFFLTASVAVVAGLGMKLWSALVKVSIKLDQTEDTFTYIRNSLNNVMAVDKKYTLLNLQHDVTDLVRKYNVACLNVRELEREQAEHVKQRQQLIEQRDTLSEGLRVAVEEAEARLSAAEPKKAAKPKKAVAKKPKVERT